MSLLDLPPDYCDGPTFIGHGLWLANEVGSGCSIIDINFPHLIKIAGISFKNYYTMEIQIWLKYRVKIGSKDHKKEAMKSLWVLAVPKMILMPHPHYEKGGNEFFSIVETRLKFLRLIQQQTRNCLTVAEHPDKSEGDEADTIRSDRSNNQLTYEVALLPDAHLARLIK